MKLKFLSLVIIFLSATSIAGTKIETTFRIYTVLGSYYWSFAYDQNLKYELKVTSYEQVFAFYNSYIQATLRKPYGDDSYTELTLISCDHEERPLSVNTGPIQNATDDGYWSPLCQYRFFNASSGNVSTGVTRVQLRIMNRNSWSDCPQGEKFIEGICRQSCDCNELKDEVANTCTPMEPATIWDPVAGVFYKYPDNNHDDAPRCDELATEVDGQVNQCDAKLHSTWTNSPQTKNPIDCATGQKKYTDLDYQGFGLDALSYQRTYSTPLPSELDDELAIKPVRFWQPRDIPTLTTKTFDDGAYAKIFKLGQRIERIFFFPAGSDNYETNAALSALLLSYQNGNDVVTTASGHRFYFNAQGLIADQRKPDEPEVQRFFYTYADINGETKLTQVANRFGRTLDYDYDAEGRLFQLTDQDGVSVFYQYDAAGNLAKVIYPDGTPADLTDNPFKEYLFENADFPGFVTGIVNQDGTRIANIAYNADGKATLSELHNGTERTEVSYPEPGKAIVKFFRDVNDTEANAYREERYSFAQFRGQYKLTAKEITKCDDCELTTETWDYNAQQLLARHTSPAGIITEWQYDDQGRKTSQTVAVGTPEASTIRFDWHATLNQIETITTATEVTTHTFDDDGNLIQTLTTPVQ